MSGRDLQRLLALDRRQILYLDGSEFRPITARNFGDYIVLAKDADFVYATHPCHSCGFVFTNSDVAAPARIGMVPVLHLSFLDSRIKGYKQGNRASIRAGFAKQGVAREWYLHYASMFGGVVADFEHLEAGKSVFKSYVAGAELRHVKVYLVDRRTGDRQRLSPDGPSAALWSMNAEKRPLVLLSRLSWRLILS